MSRCRLKLRDFSINFIFHCSLRSRLSTSQVFSQALFQKTMTKREPTLLKFSAPAIITLREMFKARYDTILNQSECTHLIT